LKILEKTSLPDGIMVLLRALSGAGFFEQSSLIGSWVMPVYKELYHVQYVLRTMDIDLAVHAAHGRKGLRTNLEQLITSIGYISYVSTGGVQKFSSSGYEVEFIVHRKGGLDTDAMPVREWNVIAQPLPFINLLIDFSEGARLHDFIIRFPIPEAFFVHKLIVAQRRRGEAKRIKDLDQCSVLMSILNDDRLQEIVQSIRMSKDTRRLIRSSCESIGFPLHRIAMD
jgi:hypothetical protein